MTQKSEPKPAASLSKEELFERLNASAQRTLDALMKAYEAGMKEGLSDEEEDQLIEILKRAKRLSDQMRQITSPPSS